MIQKFQDKLPSLKKIYGKYTLNILHLYFSSLKSDRSIPQVNFLKRSTNEVQKQKKSHTCEEGGAHLRISFWHLLMNLKNKLLLKKLLKWANKNKIVVIFTMLHFLKKT